MLKFVISVTGTGYPDFEIMMIPANATNDLSQRAFLLTDQTYEDVWKYINRAQTYLYYIVVLHAESIGTVRLRSSDPFDYPLIDNKFLSDPRGRDIEVLYEAVEVALKLARTRSMRQIGATLQGHPMRACRHLQYPSRRYWFCAIRQMSLNLYHPVGTCPMGPDHSRGAVVDSECKVHGVKGLRVVDGSVFPFTLAGHPVAAIIMVGEKVSDFIKEKYL